MPLVEQLGNVGSEVGRASNDGKRKIWSRVKRLSFGRWNFLT